MNFKSSRPYKPSATDDEVYTEIFEQWFLKEYPGFKNPNFEAEWVQEVKRAFFGGLQIGLTRAMR